MGGCTDDLNVSPGQGRFQNIGRIHAALGITCSHQIMNLIHHENDIPALFDFRNQAFHSAFKLTPELGSGHQRRQIQQENLFIPQLVGHITGNDPLCQSLCNGCFANAGFSHQAGVVFLAAI